jgi:hypothetical protein
MRYWSKLFIECSTLNLLLQLSIKKIDRRNTLDYHVQSFEWSMNLLHFYLKRIEQAIPDINAALSPEANELFPSRSSAEYECVCQNRRWAKADYDGVLSMIRWDVALTFIRMLIVAIWNLQLSVHIEGQPFRSVNDFSLAIPTRK